MHRAPRPTAPVSPLSWPALALAVALGCSPVLAQTSAAPATTRAADFIVAVVNSEPITNQEVRTRVQRLESQLARQGKVPPRAELMRDTLERLIMERAQLQHARNVGIRPDDGAVDQAVADVARQNQVSLDQLKAQLRTDGVSDERFREDIREELTLGRLRDREVEGRVKVSEVEIDRWLEEQKTSQATGPQDVHLAQILVAVPENATPAQVQALQAKAQGLLERARKGADFSALAKEFSDAPDKAAGGDLGLRPADRYPTLFVDATQALAVGELTGPVRSGAGFHLLKVVDKKRGGDVPLMVTQTHARHILLRTGPRLTEADARQQLAQFKRRIEAGQADFAALAREFSEDGSAKQGGDLGWAAPGMFVPEFEQAMNRLAPRQIAEPLVSRFGVHLIQVLERRQTAVSERERREMARAQVRDKKVEEAMQLWMQDMRGRAYVEYRDPPQ